MSQNSIPFISNSGSILLNIPLNLLKLKKNRYTHTHTYVSESHCYSTMLHYKIKIKKKVTVIAQIAATVSRCYTKSYL